MRAIEGEREGQGYLKAAVAHKAPTRPNMNENEPPTGSAYLPNGSRATNDSACTNN